MSDNVAVDLVGSNRFWLTVKCQVPGEGPNSWKNFQFDAQFEALPTEDWEELVETSTRSEALRKVLVGVGDNVPSATVEVDGQKIELTPKDVVIRNQFTCDAAFMDFNLYITKNSRDKAVQAAQSKNSKRSRGR